jgi:type I restriction enzyme S subunit
LDRQLKKIITSGARGDGLLNVNTTHFFKLKVPFPPKEEQEVLAKVFEVVDREITLLENQRDALKEQKRGLMQQLLTGKIRVKISES